MFPYGFINLLAVFKICAEHLSGEIPQEDQDAIFHRLSSQNQG